MKNILVPINFSFNSYDAIDYAIKFFDQEKCHFYFLNTFTIDADGLNAIELLQADDDWFEHPKNESEKNLGLVIQKYFLKNPEKKHQFSAISDCTNLIDGIKKVIKEIKIDLIVLPGKKDSNDSNEEYSRNTKRIIENITECPIMIIPSSAKLHKQLEFILVSNFEEEVPKAELKNWYELVKIANGTIKIVMLSDKNKMTHLQKKNLESVHSEIETFANRRVVIEYVESMQNFKNLANNYSNYIICLIDKKPSIWRMLSLNKSKITKLGLLSNSPLIALHP